MHCDAYPYRGPISSVMRCIPFFSFSRTTHKGVDSFSSSLYCTMHSIFRVSHTERAEQGLYRTRRRYSMALQYAVGRAGLVQQK